jgi:hypothetical protein
MIDVSIKRSPSGEFTLSIDARGLHEHLRAIGVPERDGAFQNQPPSGSYGNSIAPGRDMIEPCALLATAEVPLRIDLRVHYHTPPTLDRIRALAESARDCARAILDHYTPIDVSVHVVGKKKS